MEIAYFDRFAIEMEREAARDCSHSGACDDDIAHWAIKINRPVECTPEALRAELREYGAWDDEQLADDGDNWERIVWIAAGNINDEIGQRV